MTFANRTIVVFNVVAIAALITTYASYQFTAPKPPVTAQRMPLIPLDGVSSDQGLSCPHSCFTLAAEPAKKR